MADLLTPNPKDLVPVDRPLLPPTMPGVLQSTGYSAPLSPDQQTVSDVIAQVYRGTSVVRHSPLPVPVSAGTGAAINSAATVVTQNIIQSNSVANGVVSLNGLIGVLSLLAGSDIMITPGANTLTIAAGGVSSLNTLTGALTLAAGSNMTITPSGGNTLTFDSSASSSVPVQVYDDVTIGPVALSAVAATIGTLSLSMPSSGGPFRILVSYTGWIDFATFSNVDGFSCYVSDGTHTMCGFSSGQSNASSGAATTVSYSGFTTVTYANSASVTLTLFGITFTGGGGIFKETPIAGGPNSLFQAVVIASN